MMGQEDGHCCIGCSSWVDILWLATNLVKRSNVHSIPAWIGTVDNHGNTEITETVIFIKCRECRDFAKMPQFYVFTRIFCFYSA